VTGPALRVGDADRQRVVDVLAEAFGAGRLELAEYEERVTSAYAARTGGELAALTADLPRPPEAPPARSRPWPGWLTVSALCLAIWAVTCLATGQWQYPWWIWVAGPWGLALLGGHRAGRWRGDGPGLPNERHSRSYRSDDSAARPSG
jgi:hypothetical protein